MYFSHIIAQTTPLQWVILGALMLICGLQMFIYIYYLTGVLRHQRDETQGALPSNSELPPVSIVICARDENSNLKQLLPLVLEQDYPNYEVIVVNDGSSDETEMLLARLQQLYPQLRYTYTPDQVDVISRKKLALTIGIKSAHNDLLLLTDADCRPLSPHWISEMVRHMSPNTEFVLGYGGYTWEETFLNRLIAYDTLFIAMQYLGLAYRGKPYMGVGRNMMYRRSTFLAHRGFAGSLHLASGDDDLLVNKYATASNTRIATSVNSTTLSLPKTTFADWYHQKERHLTTSPDYSPRSKNRIAAEPISRGLFYALLIAAIALWNPITSGIAIVLAAMRYTTQCVIINKTATQLRTRHFYLTLPLFDVILPLITLFLLLFGRKKSLKWK